MNANPIPLPMIEISELYFDEFDNWKLELSQSHSSEYPFDHIVLYSSLDTAIIPVKFLTNNDPLVLTPDSLTTNFRINRLGDTIKVVSYVYGGALEDVLIFGNVSGASISFPKPGQSISKYGYDYVKDKSPSIGLYNDTTGMCGTMSGYIFDRFSKPVSNREIYLDFFWTKTNHDGSYRTRVLSKPTRFNRLNYMSGPPYVQRTTGVEAVEYVMEPDSSIEVSIYLLDSLYTGINKLALENAPIYIYPNPVQINGQLNIKIDLPIITSEISIEIIDLKGEMIKKKIMNQNSSSIIAPDKSGFYIVRTMLDSEVISSNKIFVNE
jgi:hypothetical protein